MGRGLSPSSDPIFAKACLHTFRDEQLTTPTFHGLNILLQINPHSTLPDYCASLRSLSSESLKWQRGTGSRLLTAGPNFPDL